MPVVARSVAVVTALGRALGVLGPLHRSAQSHERGWREHAGQTIDRIVVGLAQTPGQVGPELLPAAAAPGACALGVVLVSLGSWHRFHHLLSLMFRSLFRERFKAP
jgi:hypothetical protein